jgi:transcriptional regulator with XRE-family HTH domain
MSDVTKSPMDFSLNSYFEKNREKIDESIVSLRLMKEVDQFLEINCVKQRDFAAELGYSEAYVSQLMSGTKKINTSFINKLEKTYDLIVNFQLDVNRESKFIPKFSDSLLEFQFNFSDHRDLETQENFFFNLNNQDYLKVEGEYVDFIEVES